MVWIRWNGGWVYDSVDGAVVRPRRNPRRWKMGPALLLLVLLIAAVGYVLLRRSGLPGAGPVADGDGSIRRLIRIADSADRAKANEAIRGLGRTQSDEALEYLLGRAGGATFSVDSRTGSVLEALGEMSHPRGVERLLQVVASGSVGG